MTTHFFEGKNILLVSPEPWSHLFVSKHHYAIELSKNNQVFFLNPPSSNDAIQETEYKNVWVVDYKPFIKGLRFLPPFLQRHFMKSKFEKLQALAGVQFDCVWSFDNSVFFDFSFLPNGVFTISHIVDYSQNFQLFKAASTARLCFGVSQNIVNKLLLANKNSYLMPHGMAFGRTEKIEVTLPGKNPVKAVYAGNLDSQYLNREPLYKLAEDHPEVDFVFLGSGGADWPRRENTFFPGVIKHEQLFNYLEKADVLLMSYDVQKFPEQITNAHKVLEYLSSGKVIVSNLMPDYAGKSDLLKMADSEADFTRIFTEVISKLDWYNNTENMNLRKNFASANTYSNRILEINEKIKQTLI